MKRRFSWITVWGVIFVLSAWAFSAYAAGGDKVDLTGNWYVWLTTTGDNQFLLPFNTRIDGYPLLVLKQDGDKLSGNFKGSCFGEVVLTGHLKGHDFEVGGTLPQGEVTLKGKLESGKLNGVIDMGVHGSSDFMMARE